MRQNNLIIRKNQKILLLNCLTDESNMYFKHIALDLQRIKMLCALKSRLKVETTIICIDALFLLNICTYLRIYDLLPTKALFEGFFGWLNSIVF